MRKRSIGPLSVSVVGLGCNQFARKIDARQSAAVIDAALDAGINYLDTSDRYGNGDQPFSGRGRSEEFIGEAIRGRRDRFVVATKFGNPMSDDPLDRGGSRRWVLKAVEDSLRRLGTDYIDLYQIHRPDPQTPVDETLGALNELVEQGKVREIGCSNFTIEQLDEATRAGKGLARRFVSVQNEYSLLYREPEAGTLDFCAANGIAFLPYFPLASGLLTGKYVKGREAPEGTRLAQFPPNRPHLALTDDNLDRVGRLAGFAADHGHTLLELAFSWLLAHPQVASVIAGVTTPEQLRGNARAAAWQLSAADLEEIDKL
jgi:aryl-alcohol dehydrogenase-like predicted oxidoreductase